MIPKKKLQVFVSSTYMDLVKERQVAVEAILQAGHIPAGMELFAAGDEEQWEVIKKWIKESDVLMLILGGRYGSVEPKSGKSYIQLEYEYAVELGKPFFAVVATEEYLKNKSKECDDPRSIFEGENPKELRQFIEIVQGKICSFWRNTDQLSKEIIRSLLDKSENENLTGWIRGDTLFNLNNEIDKLKKENRNLHESLANRGSERYNGLTFDEMYQALLAIKVDLTGIRLDKSAELFFNDICEKTKSEHLNLFHILVHESYFRDESRPLDERVYSHMFLYKLQAKGLMELFTKEEEISKGNRTTILRKRFMKITNEGRRFLNKAISELDLGEWNIGK